jgi:hypothetical protein
MRCNDFQVAKERTSTGAYGTSRRAASVAAGRVRLSPRSHARAARGAGWVAAARARTPPPHRLYRHSPLPSHACQAAHAEPASTRILLPPPSRSALTPTRAPPLTHCAPPPRRLRASEQPSPEPFNARPMAVTRSHSHPWRAPQHREACMVAQPSHRACTVGHARSAAPHPPVMCAAGTTRSDQSMRCSPPTATQRCGTSPHRSNHKPAEPRPASRLPPPRLHPHRSPRPARRHGPRRAHTLPIVVHTSSSQPWLPSQESHRILRGPSDEAPPARPGERAPAGQVH